MTKSEIKCLIPVPQIEDDGYDWYGRHEAILRKGKEKKYRLVLLGASNFHYWEGDRPGYAEYGTENWKAEMAQYEPLNLGYGFDRVQNILWRLEHGELDGQDPDLILLAIGGNNFVKTANYTPDAPEEVIAGQMAVAGKARSLCPKAKIVFIVFPPRPGHVTEEKIRILHKGLAEKVSEEENMQFWDLSGKYLKSDGSIDTALFMPDRVHLNNAGFHVLMEELVPLFRELGL